MTDWQAIVPLKLPQNRKTRLNLPDADRLALTEQMAANVLGALGSVQAIKTIAILAPERRPDFSWLKDRGRGLNIELTEARSALHKHPVLIVHGDLPELRPEDVQRLINATASGQIAISPDRHGTGTNAIALPPGKSITFAFGANSFQAHLRDAPCSVIVRSTSLGFDIDTVQDLEAFRQSQRQRAEDAVAPE
jgi:2-phospho-L-lactate guanylyltransferase